MHIENNLNEVLRNYGYEEIKATVFAESAYKALFTLSLVFIYLALRCYNRRKKSFVM
jgi:hypothetical protein